MYSYLSKKFNLSRKAKVKSTWVSVNLSVDVLFFHDEYLVLVTVADFVVNDVINIGTAAHVEAAEGVSRTVTSIEPALRHLPLVGRRWRVPQDLKRRQISLFKKSIIEGFFEDCTGPLYSRITQPAIFPKKFALWK